MRYSHLSAAFYELAPVDGNFPYTLQPDRFGRMILD